MTLSAIETALHHIMVRGIEQRTIFRDTQDKQYFITRLGKVIRSTETFCYAYALMDNHYHLLLETGATPISRVMASLQTE